MDKFKIILASGSPRRKEILTNLGVEFKVIPSNKEEKMSNDIYPGDLVKELSKMKGSDVAEKVAALTGDEAKEIGDRYIVIGADTVVAYDGRVLGKPKSREDAYGMIKGFSGDVHNVFSGVYIYIKNGDKSEEINFCVNTEVSVYEMTDSEINAYLDTPEPYDKAGAYAIQGLFAPYIKGINGDYYNIVGFPIARIVHELSARGINII